MQGRLSEEDGNTGFLPRKEDPGFDTDDDLKLNECWSPATEFLLMKLLRASHVSLTEVNEILSRGEPERIVGLCLGLEVLPESAQLGHLTELPPILPSFMVDELPSSLAKGPSLSADIDTDTVRRLVNRIRAQCIGAVALTTPQGAVLYWNPKHAEDMG